MTFTVQLSPADLAAGASATIDFRSFGEKNVRGGRYTIDKRGAGLMALDMALTSTLLGKNAGADLASAMRQALTSGQVLIDPRATHPDPRVNVAILASNHVVRRIFRTAQPGSGVPWFDPEPSESALAGDYIPAGLPLVIAATVAGVAAIGGVTYYATEAKRITVSFDKMTAQLAQQAELYKTQVAAAVQTSSPIPAPPKVVQDMADAEIAGVSVWPLVAAAVTGGAGVAAYMFRRKPPVRRRNPKPAAARRATKATRRKKARTKRKTTTRRKKAATAATKRKTATKRRNVARVTTKKKSTATKRTTTTRRPNPRKRGGDWILKDVSNVHWPGALSWRGPDSRRGYASREEAEQRARRIRDHYAARYGQSGPDLRALPRGQETPTKRRNVARVTKKSTATKRKTTTRRPNPRRGGDWILKDVSNVHWPGALPWRGPDSRRGYASRKEAEQRARRVRDHYAARYGQSGPDLRAFPRGQE